MMFSSEVRLIDVVKRQYNYKIKAYLGVYTSLVVTQIIAIFFSSMGTGMSGTSSDSYSMTVSYYSGNLTIIFTMLWAFITSILITTKAYRYDDFAFVTNRLSSNLSNFFFLLTASIVGGITAMFAGVLQKVYAFYMNEGQNIIYSVHAPLELLMGVFVATLYILIFCALGYFVGMVIQLHKIFAILLPAMFFGYLFIGSTVYGEPVMLEVVNLFSKETSLLLFFVKIIVASGALFYGATVLSSRMEVRR
jgi:hypothetical protein